jgi:hypothetical protein
VRVTIVHLIPLLSTALAARFDIVWYHMYGIFHSCTSSQPRLLSTWKVDIAYTNIPKSIHRVKSTGAQNDVDNPTELTYTSYLVPCSHNHNNNNKSNSKMMQKPYSDEESDAPPSSKEQKSEKVTPPGDERQAAAHFSDIIAAAPRENNEFFVDGESLTILNPSGPLLAVLENASDDDPAVVVHFYPTAVANAVAQANANQPQRPPWMQIAGQYPITTEQLQESICEHLCLAGSGQKQGCILAPNNLQQYVGIHQRIVLLMAADPFLIAICGPPNCHPIARVYTIADRKHATCGVHTAPQAVAAPGVEVFD